MGTCKIIPFDELGCLDINILSGGAKALDFTIKIVVDNVTTIIPLAPYANHKFNIYSIDRKGDIKLVPALSKEIGAGIVRVDDTLTVTFGSETANISDRYYWNLEHVITGQPSDFYIHGYMEIRPKSWYLAKKQTTKKACI